MRSETLFRRLVARVAAMPGVVAVGKTGGPGLPGAEGGDVDVFVFCGTVPSAAMRAGAMEGLPISGLRVAECPGKHWGVCDFLELGGTDVCLMYFAVADMDAEINSVLSGERAEREDNGFYPTGRCASFLAMHAFMDDAGYIAGMRERLARYPEPLRKSLTAHHLAALEDTEDLERAAMRKDALFWHFALDLSLDHFLQALFALNRAWFPSRKRTLAHISGFALRPVHCGERLERVVALGARGETIPESLSEYSALCQDLADLCRRELGEGTPAE
ncbi:MAG TPA: DUF4037 domain-containing protein [Candidatus Limnocylindria bacterium]|nr:DUF4037 domain-containing protein [Candidatus Limnocylindria bacterium]